MVDFDIVGSQFQPNQVPVLKRLLHCVNPEKVFEIGCWLGESTSHIAETIKPYGRIYCVDWFRGNPGTALDMAAKNNNILSIFKNNMRELGYEDMIMIMVMTSRQAAELVKDDVADFVFIDASHDYMNCEQDIRLWTPKVRDGGIICGHDCEGREYDPRFIMDDYVKGAHHGVIKAVEECFSGTANIEEGIWWKKISKQQS